MIQVQNMLIGQLEFFLQCVPIHHGSTDRIHAVGGTEQADVAGHNPGIIRGQAFPLFLSVQGIFQLGGNDPSHRSFPREILSVRND